MSIDSKGTDLSRRFRRYRQDSKIDDHTTLREHELDGV
jgi:hypothetical protein